MAALKSPQEKNMLAIYLTTALPICCIVIFAVFTIRQWNMSANCFAYNHSLTIMLTELVIGYILVQFAFVGKIKPPWGHPNSMMLFILAAADIIYIVYLNFRRIFQFSIINSSNISAEEIEKIISDVSKRHNQKTASFILTQNKLGHNLKLMRWSKNARRDFIREINLYVKHHGKKRIPPMILYDVTLLVISIGVILYSVN
jgi:hypothetical protein